MPSYYEILGVSADATAEQIRAAYRSKALRLHPDRFATADPSEQRAATDQFQQLTEAHAVLSSPAKRAAYDAHLSGAAAVRVSDPSAALVTGALERAQTALGAQAASVDVAGARAALETAAHAQVPAAKRVFGLGQTPVECYSLVAFESLSMAMRELSRQSPKDFRARQVLELQGRLAKTAQAQLSSNTRAAAVTGLSGFARPRG